MPPKQAATTSTDEVDFLKACLRHYKEPMNKANFDFDTVAKETGVKDGQAAYQRFWSIKKKWGMAGGVAAGKGKGKTSGATTPNGTTKATAGKKRTSAGKVKGAESPGTANGGSDAGSAEVNAGSEDGDEGSDTEVVEESPSKKVATE